MDDCFLVDQRAGIRDEIHHRGTGSGGSARACNWSRGTGADPESRVARNLRLRSRFHREDLCPLTDPASRTSGHPNCGIVRPGGGDRTMQSDGRPKLRATTNGHLIPEMEWPRQLRSLTFVVTEYSPVIFCSRLGSMEPLQFPQLPLANGISKRRHVRFVKPFHAFWVSGRATKNDR